MDRLLQCATHALPYFSASVSFFYDFEYLRTGKSLTACKGAFNCVCRVFDQQSSAPLLPAVRDPGNWHQVCLTETLSQSLSLQTENSTTECPGLRFASWPPRCVCTWGSWTTLGKLLRMFSTDWSTTCHWWAPFHWSQLNKEWLPYFDEYSKSVAPLFNCIKWVAWFHLNCFFSATSDRGWFSGADSKPWVHKSRSSFLIKMGLTQISISIYFFSWYI